ncbi:MAG: hypothetical protein L0H79_14640 [Intrasporangium sp.]|uniref:hypothetical protein n=1 Tax=Intrasporangium sp. TaxID=1925024 RepID=UPI002649682E|nr:hypothetical protein [Intrasporangium sp.]MDN5796980.1 hypothetical protein [Intrasporangium sp.]
MTRPAERHTPADGNGVPWHLLFFAAALVTVAYIAFAIVTFNRADDNGVGENQWLRTVFVIQGLEAIAFTAIGWLFGREVHRGEAAASKEQAGEAKQEAQEARARSEVAGRDGWRLAEAIRARAEVAVPAQTDGGDENAPAGEPPFAERGLASLKSLADTLFPPR